MSTRSPGSRRIRRPAVWLAVIAMVLHALLPTLVMAASAADGERQVIEVCSSQHVQKVVVDADGNEVPASAGIKHCPCCLAGNCNAAPVFASTPVLAIAPALPLPTRAGATRTDTPADAMRVWLSRLFDGPPAV